MSYSSRPCRYPQDRQSLVDLLLSYRLAAGVELYPTIWRSLLLLTSRVWQPEQDARLWLDAGGSLLAFAMLWSRRRQSPYLALDRCVRPGLAQDGTTLAHDMLAWGAERAQAIARENAAPLRLFASALHPQVCPGERLEAFGFAPIVPDPQDSNVYFARPLQEALPPPQLPAGYTLRAVGEAGELDAYQDLYGFAAVNPQHRQELLDSDEYAHLVIADPAGALLAYCEISIYRGEWQASGQRIGWVDYIETRPEAQGRGLGRAALLAGLQHLQRWGAQQARLVTVTSNVPAIGLYLATGFERLDIHEAPGYVHSIDPSILD